MSNIEHGKPSTYNYHRCRCSLCVDAMNAYQRDYKRRRKLNNGALLGPVPGEEKKPENWVHGKIYTYAKLGCRCEPCRKASRDSAQMRRYGVTVDQLLEAQGGACAACGASEPGSNKGWHVDHDHETNAVRAALCAPCNLALGYSKESPERLEALARYIRNHTI